MMQQVLVTGVPGWLGNRLVQALSHGLETVPRPPGNIKIRCLVLPGTDTSPLQRLTNTVFWEGDLTRPETIVGAAEGCEVVFHCAGVIHPKKVSEFYRVNTEGTKSLLEEAIRSGVKRFVFVSSNSPAGVNPSGDILLKEDDPYRPYKHYGRSKMLAEQIVQQAHQSNRIETVMVRPCWFYGPGQPSRQSEFFAMIQGGRPPLFGDGKNLRSMSYIDNVVQGLILAATVERAKGEIYWIADERPYQTLEIYETIAELLGVPKLRFLKIPNFVCSMFELLDSLLQSVGLYNQKVHVAGEMNKNIAVSIEKAKRELGYVPTVDLRDGMRRSIEWYLATGQSV